MSVDTLPSPEECNCCAVRAAARHVTQSYDQFLAPTGLRTTQFSILAKLKRLGPLTINTLARDMVMDRTTLGRNILPLERDGLVRIETAPSDRPRFARKLNFGGSDRLLPYVRPVGGRSKAAGQDGFRGASSNHSERSRSAAGLHGMSCVLDRSIAPSSPCLANSEPWAGL